MNKYLVWFLLSIFLCSLTVIAALDNENPEKAEEAGRSAAFKTSTDLVEVRVVVKDREGRIVEGLKKEDFQFLENGHPQEISHFAISSIESEQAQPAGLEESKPQDEAARLEQVRQRLTNPPVRTILLYVDTLHMSFSSLNHAKETLHRFIDEQLTDQDLVAFTSSQTLGVAQQFTRDPNILKYAVEQIQYRPDRPDSFFTPALASEVLMDHPNALRTAVAITRAEESMDCPCGLVVSFAKHRAQRILTEGTYSRKNTLSIIEHFADQMKDLPGKRMIVVFSDGFTSYDESGNMQFDEVKSAVSRAARSGVVVYSINAGGLKAPPMFDFRGSTFRIDCPPECLMSPPPNPDPCPTECREIGERDAEMLSCMVDARCKEPDLGILESYIASSEQEKMNGLHALAEETGGKLYTNTNDLNSSITQALDDNRYYYVLSYYLPTDKDKNPYRQLKANIRNHPEYTVRLPRGYRLPEKKEPEDPALNTPQQRLLQAIGSPLPQTDLGVSAQANYLETEEDDKQVSLTVFIEGERFQQSQNEQPAAVSLEILSFVYNSAGEQVEGTRADVEGTLTKERMEQAKESGFRFIQRLELTPGAYQVRIGVREKDSDRIGTASTWIEVPELGPEQLEMSSLVLSNPLEMDLDDSEGIDVSSLEEVKIVQGVPIYAPEDIFYYTFRVHWGDEPSGKGNLELMHELLQGGKPIKQAPWQDVFIDPDYIDVKGWFDLDGELDISTLDPGVYEMRISVKEKDSKTAIQRTVAFGIL